MNHHVALLILLFSIPLAAQQTPPAAPKPPAAPAAPVAPTPPVPPFGPEAGGQPVNIRLDVSVTDQGGNSSAQPKTLMVILADRALGQTRAAYEDRSISVDARPTIVEGRVRANLTVKSQEPPKVMTVGSEPFKGPDPLLNWTNSFALLLDSGKPMLAFETSDPVTKRKLSIEVKATIQK
jgi:hypothetical protein